MPILRAGETKVWLDLVTSEANALDCDGMQDVQRKLAVWPR